MYRSNINYELSSKPPVPNDTERTVHNSLYTRQEIPAATTTLPSSSPSVPHVYASVGIGDDQNPRLPDLDIPQHTLLLHSTASTSDAGGLHTYSKPTTPITNYDVTGNSFLVQSPGNHSQAYSALQIGDYSKLNNSSGDPNFTHSSQSSEIDSSHYSHIDDSHKYSKLSESNSKGYSQLAVVESQVNQHVEHQVDEESEAQPYECPLSANGVQDAIEGQSPLPQPYECPLSADGVHDRGGGVENHAYSTLTVETDDAGYSKLHIFDGSQATKLSGQ